MLTIDWPTGLCLTLVSLVAFLVAGEHGADAASFAAAIFLALYQASPHRVPRHQRNELQRRTDALWPREPAPQTSAHRQRSAATVGAGASKHPFGLDHIQTAILRLRAVPEAPLSWTT
jgi:hypothetical protein